LNAAGTGYAPGDTINLAGGTQTTQAQVQVTTTKVVAAAIGVAGNGAIPNGVQTAVVLTGAGTAAQITVQVAGGVVVAINAIAVAGSYTTNPTTFLSQVLIAGNASCFLNLTMGVNSFNLIAPGVFTANPGGGTFTQGSTTGGGTGATFNTALMVPNDVHISTAGAYTVFPASPAAQAATSGTGVGVTFNIPAAPVVNNGDWFELSGIGGMTQLNGRTVVAAGVAGLSFNLTDVYGNNIDTSAFTAYTAGGSIARIFTLGTPWSEVDLAYLKFTQSKDVMSICCVNQVTRVEYPPQDLERFSDTSWALAAVVPAPSVAPPAGTPTVATSSAGNVTYQFQITAVSPQDGSESIASGDRAGGGRGEHLRDRRHHHGELGRGRGGQRVQRLYDEPGRLGDAAGGALFGFVGKAYGTQFINSNIIPDFAQVPPTHQNPFARGQIVSAQVGAGGAAYADVGFTITTSTGTGAVLQGVLIGGALAAIIVKDAGQNYRPGDTVTVTSGTGAGAIASLTVGAQLGTYPGVVAYFQERRAYAYTLNNPDTYFMSQPGAFTNFDSRIPTIDTDAIIGSPWSVQVNGVQWMLPTTGGLMVFTGLQTWLLVGQGSFATNVGAISPSSQVTNPQPEIGCSPIIEPVKINYDVLFFDSNSSFCYDQPYQLYSLSEPIDLTQNSPHLFTGYTFVSRAWCRRPYKLMWAVRDDGALLEPDVSQGRDRRRLGAPRHAGPGGEQLRDRRAAGRRALPRGAAFPGVHTAYMIERMDNRIWFDVEDTWAVDCALSLAQPAPNATLTASSATGTGAISGVTGLVGGAGYSAATTVRIIDAPTTQNNGPGPGAGATAHATSSAASSPRSSSTRRARTISTRRSSSGPGGLGRRHRRIGAGVLNNSATFTASANVFTNPASSARSSAWAAASRPSPPSLGHAGDREHQFADRQADPEHHDAAARGRGRLDRDGAGRDDLGARASDRRDRHRARRRQRDHAARRLGDRHDQSRYARRRPSWSGSASRRSCRRPIWMPASRRCRGSARRSPPSPRASSLARRQGRLEPAGRLDHEPAAAEPRVGRT
jgi:hypothetical protein